MTLVMVLLTIAVVAGVTAVATGLVSGGLAEPAASIPARALPNHPPTGQDVAELRFVQAFRGYRMDQVDAAMDALGAEVDRLRGLLAERGEPGGAPATTFEPGLGAGSAAGEFIADRADRTDLADLAEQSERAGAAGFGSADRD